MRKVRPDAVLIFVRPPSLEALRRRLEGRRQDAPEVIERRLRCAEEEIAKAHLFDHVVINEQLEQAIARIQALIDEARAH